MAIAPEILQRKPDSEGFYVRLFNYFKIIVFYVMLFFLIAWITNSNPVALGTGKVRIQNVHK